MARIPDIYIKTNYDEQRIIDFSNVQIYLNGEPLQNVVDCQLTIENFGRTKIDIIQDEFIYNLRK
jgi:hypothetical protein